jgi:hypothetical protein
MRQGYADTCILKEEVLMRRIRRVSERRLLGMPLWCIARGPDPRRGEERGVAKGFFAIGDVAIGVFALGGVSIGVVSVGGISLGAFTLGGIAVGLGFAMGGVAVALTGFAFGGVAVGLAAYGGVAVGIWAKGACGAWAHKLWEKPAAEVVSFLARNLPWLG